MANTAQTRADSETIEGMIDRHGMAYVLDLIAEIMHEKADHVRTNWQDERLAKTMTSNARIVERAAASVRP